MIENNSIYLIGLGHRARNGKDSVANFIYEYIKKEKNDKYDCKIIHFSDALYEECKNQKYPTYPLIEFILDSNIFYIQEKLNGEPKYIRVNEGHELFHDLNSYWMDSDYFDVLSGMKEKDSKLLQFWGTNYRRRFFGENYWVSRLDNSVNMELGKRKLDNDNRTIFILIPDTRFFNELVYVRKNNGKYIVVRRFDEKGIQYIDPDRDPNHPSEKELEGIEGDYTIDALCGDMNTLNKKSVEIINEIIGEIEN
jgi:hypothetical protein